MHPRELPSRLWQVRRRIHAATGWLAVAGGLGLALAGQALAADTLYIYAGKLLADPGRAPREAATVVVSGQRVVAIHDGYRAAEKGGRVIDLREHFVMPGLMDAHVHLMAQPSTFVNRARRRATGPITPSALAVETVRHAQRTLAAGFTTVRDLGSNDESVFAIRDAINAGDLPGPTILVSGPTLSATGGHGDRGFGASASLDPDERLREGVCDGAGECTHAVRYLIRIGADVIKFTASGGFLSGTGTAVQYLPEEMRAIVETAHGRGLKVAAHAYDAAAILDAVNAGVDSIEHGWRLDDAGIRAMKKRGTFLVPTLLISRPSAWADMAGTGKGAELRDEARAFEKAHAAGVKIAFGTDVGMFDHGQNALEFAVMAELGMRPEAIIRSATINTAELFGMPEERGRIADGAYADIIAVRRNPLEDIRALEQVDFVMKGGTVVKQDGNWSATVETFPVGRAVRF